MDSQLSRLETLNSVECLDGRIQWSGKGPANTVRVRASVLALSVWRHMAHIETIQTGFRTVTHVQGRVYRQQVGQSQRKPEQSLSARTNLQAKQRRRVCLLSARDARWLEDHGVSQPCFGSACQHAHHTRARIAELVAKGELRWIGASKNVAAWHEHRVWKGVPSGGPMGAKVMQLVSI